MISEKTLSVFFTVLYVVLSLLVLSSIYKNIPVHEFATKIFTLLSLSFFYLTNVKKINIWFVLVMVSCIISDSLLVYGTDFRLEGIIFLLLSRIFYIILLKDVIFQFSKKQLLFYSIPFFITFFLVFYAVSDLLDTLLYPSLIFGLTTVVVGLLSFLNYLYKFNLHSLYFFFGIFLVIISDILMTLSAFLGEKPIYVVIYHVFYYVALYLICLAMIGKKLINRLV